MSLAPVCKISGFLHKPKVFRERAAHASKSEDSSTYFSLVLKERSVAKALSWGIFFDLSGFGSSKCDLKMIKWTKLLAWFYYSFITEA